MSVKVPVRFFGCGKVAVGFYKKYKNEIVVECAISNNPKEKMFSPENGCNIEVNRPNLKEKDGSLIILCSEAYPEMAEQLMLFGYKPFQDFIDYELAEAMLSEKKLVLFYGFCHLRGIKDYLHYSNAFSDKYRGYFCPNYLFQNEYEQCRLRYLAEHCSVFVYGMAVTAKNHWKNEAVLSGIGEKTKKICVQCVYFGGYFPQMNRMFNAMNPYAIKCENYDYTPFSYGDSWLNACIDKGMMADDVLEKLSAGGVYGSDFIKRYIEEEWKRLWFLERQSDIKIAGYIQENFQKGRLFRNEAHMENDVLKEYAMQMLEILGLSKELPEAKEPLMRCSEHIIYPEVARALELEWDVEKEELEVYTYSGWKLMRVKEYIEQYIQYCSDIKRLKENNMLP